MSQAVDVFGVTIHAQTLSEALTTIRDWARDPRQRRFVSTCSVYTLMKALEDPLVGQALAGADMVTADGMPLVWIQHWRAHRRAERVYGPDIMEAFFARPENCQLRHVLLGGDGRSARLLAEKLAARCVENGTVIMFGWPHSDEANAAVDEPAVQQLNEVSAHVIWVGLGSPKQDVWMARYRPHLNAPVLIGVGAAFDFLSGRKQQCPRWLRQRGFEWLFRLVQEPCRLWRRYLIYNTRFIVRLVRSRYR